MKKLFLIAATFYSLTVVADPFCNSQLAKPKEQLVFSKLYKNQTVDAIKEKHVQFGFESEYVENEAGPLLKAYMPDPDHFPVTQKQWLEMTDEQRLDFILDNEDAMFPYRKMHYRSRSFMTLATLKSFYLRVIEWRILPPKLKRSIQNLE
jgi:hypothetical protein